MPLSPTEIKHFRERLRARDQELRQAIHSALVNNEDKTYAEVAGQVLDSTEQSMADVLADVRIHGIQKDAAEQADVVAALARVTNGSYGVCADCGDDIGSRRLEAWPTAKRCIGCQTRHEARRRGAHDSTPSL